MTYLIDAWLDRPHPYLRILHRETGEVCAVLEEEALNELQDQGDLDFNGLNSSEPLVLKELVRNLFLFCYARALRPIGTAEPHEHHAKIEIRPHNAAKRPCRSELVSRSF